MDLETLFYIAIAALYLLSRVMGKKRKAPKSTPKRPTPDRAPVPTTAHNAPHVKHAGELEDALREIRSALGWELPEPKPVPPPKTVPPPVEAPPPVAVNRPEQHAASRGERVPPKPASKPAAKQLSKPELPAAAPALLSASATEDDAGQARLEEMRNLLRNPATAREAFLMSEIFARRRRRL